jgi:hypothetical protein
MRTRIGSIQCVSPTWRTRVNTECSWMPRRGCLALLLGLILTIPAWPQQQPPDFIDMSLEDLMNIKVTSASKKEQKSQRLF